MEQEKIKVISRASMAFIVLTSLDVPWKVVKIYWY